MLSKKQVQVITFTSSSTAKNFVKMIDEENLQQLLEGVVIASIGPITSDTARNLGLNVTLEANEYTIPGLVQGIIHYFQVDKK
jgi:uroporphyrinogen III methyltransferase / synthase